MKKLPYVLLILTMLMLSACGQNAQIENNTETQYIKMNALYRSYSNAQELVEDADAVFVGKVTKISFQVLDKATALLPTEETSDDNLALHTIYDIDIEVSYKGDSSIKQIRQIGGIKDFRTEEQVSILKNANAWKGGILLLEEMTKNIEIGQTYLFAVAQFETGLPTLYNPVQSFYNMHNPFEKHPNMTAKSIISAFGQDKWDTYWNQWKVDNPNWESWIDQ